MPKPPAVVLDVEPDSASPNRRRRWRLWWPILGGVTAAAAVILLFAKLSTSARSDARRIPIATLSIEPFATPDSALRWWNSQTFAESLAVQLASIRGLDIRVGQMATAADFTLQGSVTRRDGRLVVTTRLHRAGDAEFSIWTATYWRPESPGVALAVDIVAGVAEALCANLVCLDFSSKPRR